MSSFLLGSNKTQSCLTPDKMRHKKNCVEYGLQHVANGRTEVQYKDSIE